MTQKKLNVMCVVCGKTTDLLVAFTKYKVCGDCTRKKHKEVTKK